jgi:hypothetical protein
MRVPMSAGERGEVLYGNVASALAGASAMLAGSCPARG